MTGTTWAGEPLADPADASSGPVPVPLAGVDEELTRDDGERPGGPEEGPPDPSARSAEDENPDERDLADEPEEAVDAGQVLARLASLLGAPSLIDVGDVRVRGQNATGPGATAIGTVNITTTGVDSGGRTWSETLSGAWVRQLADGYAPTPSDQQLDRLLEQRHLLCLSGPEGTGRQSAACLASARRHGLDQVAVLDAEQLTDLLRPDGPLRPGYGHVLRLTDGAVRELDGMTLVALAARAEMLGSTLLLVGDFGRRDHALAGHLVSHRPAAPGDVFRAQLRRLLRGHCVGWCSDSCVGDCLDPYVDECVAHPLLAAHLSGGPRVGEVVRLAELMAQSPPRTADLTDRLERLLPRQLHERATSILAVGDTSSAAGPWSAQHCRAFRVSCAVLAGLPVTEIHAAGRLLAASGSIAEFPAPAPASLAGGTVEALVGPVLRQAVLLVDDDRPTGGRRLEFSAGNDQLRTSLLDVAWSDWWPPEQLLGWLAELVRTGSPGVREAAAGSIGWAGRHGVRAALHTVDLLARERRAGVRQAAAVALVAMAMQPQLRQPVRVELDRWATGGPAHLRDTVARAYASGLARLWPDAALVQLRRIAEARMQRWHNSVVRGLVEVHAAGHAERVLPALAEWSTSPDPEVRLHAGRALRVLADRWAPAPREHWPELLDLVRGGTVAMTDLVTCWAAALSLPGTAYRAWRTLGFWLNRADRQPEVAAYCLELLARLVAGREPLRRRLEHQLRHVWAPLMPRNTLLDDVRRLTIEEPR
ncbi:hypothetical protein [Micromonospora coxensis]|uniref:HEAT repeat-containing protein n=1 Tax=Micromonospora coxensis TaxID=356852 RepID=A0A1C5JUG9_9ACTN|nr:hypothetical protein [Micromonospora coxensis]SCG74133.1 hypothetical protein GA0070614_5378 [Micromonospora coxensis]